MNIDDVGLAWIGGTLGWPVTSRSSRTCESISRSGDTMGSVYRVGCDGRTFVFKGPPDDSSEWGNLLVDMGMREVQTYRLLESRGAAAPKVSPACYWSALLGGGSGALALEDLGPAPALSRTMTTGLSREQALAAVRCLAVVHASFAATGRDAHASPYPWLYTSTSTGLIKAIRMGLDDLRRMAHAFWPGRFTTDELNAVTRVDVPEVLEQSHSGAPFAALCHGDAWPGNLLFADDSEVTACLIDWQFATWGNALSDVAFLFFSSLTPQSLKEWQPALLDAYHAALVSHCDIDVSQADCQNAFDQSRAGAALVTLATLDGFTADMRQAQLSRFAPRVAAAIDIVTGLGSR
jgi:hypothetical protein